LKKYSDKYSNLEISADFDFELALLYKRLGDKYVPKTQAIYKDYLIKSHNLCNEIIKKYPNYSIKNYCNELKNAIERKELSVITEKIMPINKPFLTLVNYRNMDKIYYKIVPTDIYELREKRRGDYNDFLKHFISKDKSKIYTQNLVDDKNFQNSTTEIKIEGLNNGKYIIILSNDKNFDVEKEIINYSILDISDISFLTRQNRNSDGISISIFDRTTGNPLQNCSLTLYSENYDKNYRSYKLSFYKTFKADVNGNIKIDNSDNKNFYFEFNNGNDKLFIENNFYLPKHYSYDKRRNNTYFFTDRKIYRPGQTIFFKGIVINNDYDNPEKNQILKDFSSKVVLKDVNYQTISELNLKTNEFGTFSGSFTIPKNLLNGQMSIYNESTGSSYSISVEEYKRPNFEVVFKDIAEEYKLKDKISMKGNAKAYSGYNIDNALVKYRVVRNVYYPYFRYYYFEPISNQTEIANGFSKTDKDGNFEINFEAMPDLTIPFASNPAFNFTVYADVTDINGETISSQKNINLGYTSLD